MAAAPNSSLQAAWPANVFAATALLWAAAAAGQPADAYRPGLPEVLAPAPSPEQQAATAMLADIAAFGARYQRAGRPRAVVFWNRELDDELTDRRTETVDLQAAGVQVGPAVVGTIVTNRRERLENPRPPGGLPPTLGPLQAAFVQQLAEQGVRLVDRATLLRLEHAQGRRAGKAEGDSRAVEIDAVNGRAELILEITVLDAGPRPDKVVLKVLAKDTRGGALLFALTARGDASTARLGRRSGGAPASAAAVASAPASHFVAGPDGFEPVVAPPPTLDDLGRLFAGDVVAAWSRTLATP